ncbi:hypothetical protein SAMN06265338_1248 [Rhodoblastus acidophilus]|uniref:Uncharacterized protein n=1 Tax=Rhodoblastus acidophilus TaxID=1074 RepID=A0A212SBU8_RHOAC|nr:hypothetical protein [Rhodoblastus acidophilus]PPQ35405.1 hypothetical protein CKO16_20600 [Rhodoblastus acidophilus]RAI17030.1 hypothetical protein CH337_18215 [Rhodoblastus acidophilus]SNB83016.1 hypothetical protein SAMN06265338_1248 [Rhodoblastus acidophilus]
MKDSVTLQKACAKRARNEDALPLRIESVAWRTVYLNNRGENVGRLHQGGAGIVSTIHLARVRWLERLATGCLSSRP